MVTDDLKIKLIDVESFECLTCKNAYETKCNHSPEFLKKFAFPNDVVTTAYDMYYFHKILRSIILDKSRLVFPTKKAKKTIRLIYKELEKSMWSSPSAINIWKKLTSLQKSLKLEIYSLDTLNHELMIRQQELI
eukprot:Awhi_evm1s7011